VLYCHIDTHDRLSLCKKIRVARHYGIYRRGRIFIMTSGVIDGRLDSNYSMFRLDTYDDVMIISIHGPTLQPGTSISSRMNSSLSQNDATSIDGNAIFNIKICFV